MLGRTHCNLEDWDQSHCRSVATWGIRDVKVHLCISRQSRMGERPEKTPAWHFAEGLLRPLAKASLETWSPDSHVYPGCWQFLFVCQTFTCSPVVVVVCVSSLPIIVMMTCDSITLQVLCRCGAFFEMLVTVLRNPSHAEALLPYGVICIWIFHPKLWVCQYPWAMARSCLTLWGRYIHLRPPKTWFSNKFSMFS